MDLGTVSLVSGWLPITLRVIAFVVLAVALWRYWPHRWRRPAIAAAVTAALVLLAVLLVDVFGVIPYDFSNWFYAWVAVPVFALALLLVGWRTVAGRWRAVEVAAVVLTVLAAAAAINQDYRYYPTLDSLFGQNAKHEVSLDELMRQRSSHPASHSSTSPQPVHPPDHGETVEVKIPGAASGMSARDTFIWVPPIWLVDSSRSLPVIMLLEGDPGVASDWTRAGLADTTADAYARAHGGVAPIIVMPDKNGPSSHDTECVDSLYGKTETFLTVDVPAYLRQHFGAATAPQSFAVAGLSSGGSCAIMLALRHRQLFTAFGTFSGLAAPTIGEHLDPEGTTAELFGGDSAAYAAHDASQLLGSGTWSDLGGWFEVGASDGEFTQAQEQLVPLAQRAGVHTCYYQVPGGKHDFGLWADAFRHSLPWLAYRLGLTGPVDPAPATCS